MSGLIKPCPCGKTPTKISPHAEYDKPKWAYAVPDCCGTWEIEYRNDYADTDSDEGRNNALEAWNDAPRAALAETCEPVAMRYDGDGDGYLYIDNGSGSDWQRRHNDAEPLYTTPPSIDALIAEIESIVKCAETATDGDTGDTIYIGEAYPADDVKAVLDKYRAKE